MSKITAEQLGHALGLGRIHDDELLGILVGVFPLGRFEGGRTVSYFEPQQGHALDVVYSKGGAIARLEPRPGLTAAIVETLRELAQEALAEDSAYEITRAVLFSYPEVKGCWRHGDDWQILPAPADAPRPDFLIADHPFLLEYRTRGSSSTIVATTRRQRRLWELHLLLSLMLRGQVTSEQGAHEHHWVILYNQDTDESSTAYVNEGYMVGGGFVPRSLDFTEPSGVPKLESIGDERYYRSLAPDRDEMDVPASLDEVFGRFEAADLLTREQLLAACYWLDAAHRAWHTSKSLSFIAAISAVEALLPRERSQHRCTVCGKNYDDPGPTQRFRDFVRTYAASEGAAACNAMYDLRSTLVHGGELRGLDVPSAWGSMLPARERHRDLHSTALSVARTAILTWFRDDRDAETNGVPLPPLRR